MKTKLLIASLLIFSVLAFIATKPSKEISAGLNNNTSAQELPPADEQFIIGAMDNAFDLSYDKINELGLNTWHQYTAPRSKGWLLTSGGGYDSTDNIDNSDVPPNVGKRLDSNNTNGIYSLMDRPKFEYLAFGQRSDYQCESLAVNSPYWFYSYYNHEVGNDVSDSGQMVRHCTTNSGAGWIVKDLKSNREQAHYRANPWTNDDYYKWYVMPKIRIKTADALLNKRVCRIDILRWDGNLVDSIVINSNNFGNINNSYNGQYLLQYFDLSVPLEINSGRVLNPEDNFFANWDTTCYIDFRVHYYNECEMWIDYVRVENQPAYELLTKHLQTREDWITQEVENALSHGGNSPWKFYVEEFEFNTVPCLEYLNERIETLSQGRLSLMVNLNHQLFQAHVPYYYYNDLMTAEDIEFNGENLSSGVYFYSWKLISLSGQKEWSL